MANRCV